MAKSRKRPPSAGKLKGGVGDAPAGRGSFADQLFQAREQGKAGSGRNLTEYDALPEPDPNPENRFIEDFQTVEDDLRRTMASNRKDPAKVATFKSLADAMTSMMDELPKEADPEMRTRMAEAASAYQKAFKSQSPDQKAHILAFVAPERQADVAKFYDRDAIVDFNQGGQINLPFMDRVSAEGDQALRAGRATAMDIRGDEAEYIERGGLEGRRPYMQTERGQTQRGILANLIGEGIDPQDLYDAQLGDAALMPYSPGEGVYLDRSQAPAGSRLSDFIGSDAAKDYRPEERVDPGTVGQELRSQYRTIRAKGLEPVLGPLLGEKVYSPDQIQLETPQQADITAALQMKPEIVKNQEELFRRAFGDTGLSALMDSSRGDLSNVQAKRMGGLPNIDRMAGGTDETASWLDSLIQQVMPDGSIGYGDWNAEQALRTIINQNQFLAESPHLREAAYQILLPQVEKAMQAKLATRQAPPMQTYDRNPAGRALLQQEGGDLTRQAPAPMPPAAPPRPAGPTQQQLKESIDKALRSRTLPGQNDLGFADPMALPKYMASAMPNRLLASLIG
jgi:hypothetical protein